MLTISRYLFQLQNTKKINKTHISIYQGMYVFNLKKQQQLLFDVSEILFC